MRKKLKNFKAIVKANDYSVKYQEEVIDKRQKNNGFEKWLLKQQVKSIVIISSALMAAIVLAILIVKL